MLTNNQPIMACSTGLSCNSAISIIRLSGFENILDLQNYFTVDLNNIKKRYATQSKLLSKNKIIDDVIILFFATPYSYTGENILEIHCHGNLLNVQKILDLFLRSGIFVLAQHGEFSYRALKNKKLSFSQIEGLESFLNAKSSLMLDEGLSLLNGQLKSEYEQLFSLFLDFKSSIDLLTDFSEDIGEQETINNLNKTFSKFKRLINNLHYRANIDVDFLKQAKITIFGQTNAGKSSLFNQILGKNRALISPIEGTTRDYISDNVNLEDQYFELIDTAGIRQTTDQIEEMGIELATKLLKESFYKILVVNPNSDFNLFETAAFDIKYDLLLISHLDQLKKFKSLNKIRFSKIMFCDLSGDFGPIEPIDSRKCNDPQINGPIGAVSDILKHGSIGPDQLINNFKELFSIICNKYESISLKSPIVNKRHRHKICNLHVLTTEFSIALEQEDLGILSFYSQKLSYEISDLIGFIDNEKSLNNIFDNFCIGK